MYFKYPKIWTEVLPYVSWQEPAVKQALVAATLADRNMTSGLISSNSGLQAIGHYNAAIREALKRKLSVESLLLVSVLAWLYETMNENALNGFIHLRAAQRILKDRAISQAASATSSGLSDLLEVVSVTVSEAEVHTRQIFVESPESSVESSPSPPSDGDDTGWAIGAVFKSSHHSIKILEFCMKHLLDHRDTERKVIAQVIIWLNRWIVAYRSYEPIGLEGQLEAQVVLRLYKVMFALIQLRLHHASEDDNRRCTCGEKMIQISSLLSNLLGELALVPSIEDCLQLVMMYRWSTSKRINGSNERLGVEV